MYRTYFLACIISVSSFVAGQTQKHVLKGTVEKLKPDISGHPSAILWKHNGNKVVEFNGTVQQVFGSYENRIFLNWITAELEIAGLRFEDSGNYEAEIFINNYLHSEEYQLEVINKVAKPIISCKINKGSSPDGSEVQATLLCSAVKPDSLLKFEWRSQGSSYPGDKITLSLKDQKDLEKYTCAVSNPLSSETATFTVMDCSHEENSSLALIIALSISALIAVVGTVLGILFCKLKQKACFANDEEKQATTKEPENRISQKETLLSKGDVNSQANPSEQRETKDGGSEGPDEVAEPTISCEINKGSNQDESEVQAPLLCSAEQAESLMKFERRSQGSSYPGDKITFSLQDKADDEQHTCVASNPLSSETARFTVKDCYQFSFRERVKQSEQRDQTQNGDNRGPGSKVVEQQPSRKETSATTTDETSHWTETSSDIPTLTENEDK